MQINSENCASSLTAKSAYVGIAEESKGGSARPYPEALIPSSIGSRFRMMRSGCSLRTHRRMAVDAVTGSLPRINPAAGNHGSHGIGGKPHDDEADHGITKSCDHPGQGDREQEKRCQIEDSNPPGANASAASHSDPAMVTANRTAKVARLANMLFSAASACIIAGGCALGRTLWLLIRRRAVQTTAYNTLNRREFQSEIEKMAVSASADIASALWYRGPGKAEIRREDHSSARRGRSARENPL